MNSTSRTVLRSIINSSSIVFLLAITVLLSGSIVSVDAAAPKPNIIFILADDLGYGDIGCYGQKKILTPSIDRIAAEGIRFTQFYAGTTVCAPSRCVLMTGLHTGHCWVRGNAGKQNPEAQILRPDEVTVPKLLKKAGYANALVGKWGLGESDSVGVPNRQGFDYFFGYLDQHHAHNYYPSFLWRNEARVPLQNEVPGAGPFGQGWATKKTEYSHDLFAAEALQWVEQNATKPFFLYLAMTMPHANNEATRGIGNGQEVPDVGIYRDRDWPEPSKGYAAMITRMDTDVGRLLSLLKKLRIDDNTLVIFTSDNGPQKEGGSTPEFFNSSGPLRGIKRDLYEGGIRVPLVARWPGKIKRGTVSDHIGYFGDFMATAAELAGVDVPSDRDSISFLPALLGQPQRAHDYLYWEFHEQGFKQAIRMGNWKTVHFAARGKTELYDLKSDIGEQRDLADEHPELVKRLGSAIRAAHADSALWPVKIGKPKKTGQGKN